MDDLRTQLTRCFTAVFPDLSPAEAGRATPRTLPAWDSLANVTLVSVIEEEFAVQIPLEELESLDSFELILAFLRSTADAR